MLPSTLAVRTRSLPPPKVTDRFNSGRSPSFMFGSTKGREEEEAAAAVAAIDSAYLRAYD